MFFAEYSLLAMFDTYPASKCTTQNMYTRICAGLVAIVSLRTALGSLKEEEERKKEEGEDALPEISGHGPIFSVYSSVYAIVEVNGRRWELGIKHRR